MVNPGSVVLSGDMMLRYLGWTEAAELILKGPTGGAVGAGWHRYANKSRMVS